MLSSRFRTSGIALATTLILGLVLPTATADEQLRWSECKDSDLRGVECTTITVPRDWSDPADSNRFTLPVGRIKATGPTRDRIGVLIYNPGGPGAPAVPYLRDIHRNLPESIQHHFDLVTWNPRGTDGASPSLVECTAPEIEIPATGPIDWRLIADEHTQAMRIAHEECFTANIETAPFLGTWQSARDIDALRQALGERQINFWGMSYGTTMGRIYAQTFPNRVRTLLLDGAIDPQATTGSYAREQMWSHAMSMARMTQWFTPAVRAAQRKVKSELDVRTLTTSWGASITRAQVEFAIAEFSARQFNFARARTTILTARDALFDPSAKVRQRATDRLADLVGVARPGTPDESSLEDFVLSFVNCADFPERIGDEEIRTVTEQSARISGIASGMYAVTEATMCVGLPNYGIPIEQRAAIRIPNPPIVLNSVADPYTSLWSATLMANAFADARMITYDSTLHVIFTRTNSPCVIKAVTNYLISKQRPSKDIACSLAPPFSR